MSAPKTVTVQITVEENDLTTGAWLVEVDKPSQEQAFALRELAALAGFYREQLFTFRPTK